MKKPNKNLLIIISAVMIAVSIGINLLLDMPTSLATKNTTHKDMHISAIEGSEELTTIILRRTTTPKGRTAPIESFLHENDIGVLTVSYPPNVNDEEIVSAIKEHSDMLGAKLLLLTYENSWQEAMAVADEIDADAMTFITPTGGLYSGNKPYDESIPTLLLGTSTDTAPSPDQLTSFYNSLSGDSIRANGLAIKAERGSYKLRIVSTAVDAYEAYSSQLMAELAGWTNGIFGTHISLSSPQNTLLPLSWLIGVLGMITMLISLYFYFSEKLVDLNYATMQISVVKKSHYAASKAFMWLASLPMLLIVLLILWLLPLGNIPVLGVLFCGYLGSYGISMSYLYKTGKVQGIEGTLGDNDTKAKPTRITTGVAIELLVIAFILYLGQSGLYTVSFSISGLLWFVFYGIMCYLGIDVILYELLLLDQSKISFWAKSALTIIPFVPYAALAVLALPASSYTHVLTVLFYIAVLVTSLLLARLVQLITGIQKLAAVSGAIIVAGFIAFAAL